MCIDIHIALNVDTLKNKSKFKIWFLFRCPFTNLRDLVSTRNDYLKLLKFLLRLLQFT